MATQSGAVHVWAHASDEFAPGTLPTYLETFAELCFVWCSVIELEDTTLATGSSLIDHAVASVASLTRPTVISGTFRHQQHYERARHIFYHERDLNSLTLIKAAMILPCYEYSSARSPTDSSFWWLGAAIRLAQDICMHRAARETNMNRRIWWALFARERVLALCQGRPCAIAEQDCTLGQVQLEDFPAARRHQARLFLHWVDLCRIIGNVQKHIMLARQTGQAIPKQDIAVDLLSWLDLLPHDLRLSILNAHTMPFSQDIHVLHLPYLTTIILVCLCTPGAGGSSSGASMAAACVARIARDVLLRGVAHAMPEDCGWYFAIASIALLRVLHPKWSEGYVSAELHVLRTTLEQLSQTFSSARLLSAGLDRLLNDRHGAGTTNNGALERSTSSLEMVEGSLNAVDEVSWVSLLPFASADTSPLMGALLVEVQRGEAGTFRDAIDIDVQSALLRNQFPANDEDFLSETI